METVEEKIEKMKPVTLSFDDGRHEKLKTTARRTRLSMSEITRIALDRLWTELGDLNRPTPEALAILFNSGAPPVPMGAREKRPK